ncbi:coiled-coil domain-containing protein 170-like [Thalassophryne amazonica]|uniref:coiled-coil domain-containing protein 170-like n=1 Tax=Thalassophryne amazonica TaxID=390379 RepID=UPI001471586D|nr:coiled-coil domain-containing protein 170-like [Thalassophryne amazonica]
MSQGETQTAQGNLQAFLEKVASLLQGDSVDVLPTERKRSYTEWTTYCERDKDKDVSRLKGPEQAEGAPAQHAPQGSSQERKTRDDQQQLSMMRQSLAQLSERERELVDFRLVVSQMLGLDATNGGATVNYKIIKLLESLLHTHHHHHHINMLCHCPAHHRLHHPQTQQLTVLAWMFGPPALLAWTMGSHWGPK